MSDADASGDFDVVICGAGLAGLTLALQLQRQLPELSVAIVDRQARPLPEAAHKVGESSVEVGSRYLERLGLGEYLRTRQIVKFGLRFFSRRRSLAHRSAHRNRAVSGAAGAFLPARPWSIRKRPARFAR